METEYKYTALVEKHFDRVRSSITELKNRLKNLHAENRHLNSDIFPIYEETMRLTGEITELKIAFRLNDQGE